MIVDQTIIKGDLTVAMKNQIMIATIDVDNGKIKTGATGRRDVTTNVGVTIIIEIEMPTVSIKEKATFNRLKITKTHEEETIEKTTGQEG